MKKYTKIALFLIGSLFVCEKNFACNGLIHSARNFSKFSTCVLRSYVITHRNFSTVRLADPTYDSSFKALFGNEIILKAFLSDIIPHVLFDMDGNPYIVNSIDHIATDHCDVKNNCDNKSDTTNNKSDTNDNKPGTDNKSDQISNIRKNRSPFKRIIFDIFCKCHVENAKTHNPLVVDIEMQRETGHYFLDRMDYYAARKLAEQVPNTTYSDINPVLVIAISKTYFPNYRKSGAVFLSNHHATLPILGIDSKTEPKNRSAMSNVVCIQLDNMYEMLTNKTEFEKVKKLFPQTTILFDMLNIDRFAEKGQSFSLADGKSEAPKNVDKGIYEVEQDGLPTDSGIVQNVIEELSKCAKSKEFPEEVSDTEKFGGLVDDKYNEGFEKGEEIGAIKAKLGSLSKLFSDERNLSSNIALLPLLGFNNEQEAKNFWDQNKYLLEPPSKPDTKEV